MPVIVCPASKWSWRHLIENQEVFQSFFGGDETNSIAIRAVNVGIEARYVGLRLAVQCFSGLLVQADDVVLECSVNHADK